MVMDFIVLVWKWVWKITFFGLKSGQDLKNKVAHPTKNSQEYPPPPGLVAMSRNLKKGDLATLGRPCGIGWENNEQTKLTMVPSQKPKELRPMGDAWGTI